MKQNYSFKTLCASIITIVVLISCSAAMAVEQAKRPAGLSPLPASMSEAVSFEGMSLAKFRSLSANTKIKTGNSVMTRSELEAKFTIAQQTEFAKIQSAQSQVRAEVETRRAALRQAHKAKADAQNARIKAELSAMRSMLPPEMTYTNPPDIADVKGTAMNEGYLMIKGKNFGKEPGRVILKLKGNIPGGQVELVTDSAWSDDHVAARVSLPNGGVPAQNDAMLQIIRKDGAASNWYGNGKIIFEPELDSDVIVNYGQVNCSDNAWSNVCYNQSSFYFAHFGAPDGTTYKGTDTYTVELKNGWKTISLNGNANGGIFKCEGWQEGVPHVKIDCAWEIPTPKLSPIPANALYGYFAKTGKFIRIEGPKGMPWR